MIDAKIKSGFVLAKICAAARKQGKKVVFTNGCFDLVHYGHVKYLEQAKKKGDILVVALNSDVSVRRLKGASRPIVSQRLRAGVIAALESVDYVTIFNELTPLHIIKKLKPQVLIKGSDWNATAIVGAEEVVRSGGTVVRANFHKGCSTTRLIEKIVKTNGLR